MQGSGNEWRLDSLQLVLLVGMAASVIPTVAYFYFDDSKTLDVTSEGLLSRQLIGQEAEGGTVPPPGACMHRKPGSRGAICASPAALFLTLEAAAVSIVIIAA